MSATLKNNGRLLVTGASGQLGWNVALAAERCGWTVFGVRRTAPQNPISNLAHRSAPFTWIDCDLASQPLSVFVSSKPDAVIHCAAVADTNTVQQQPDSTVAINVDAPRALAVESQRRGITLVHVSTDLVFDGLDAPYGEEDPPNPLSAYGIQKVRAEEAVRGEGGMVCRLPLLLGGGPAGTVGALHWLLQAMSHDGATLFTDEFRSPLTAQWAAIGLLSALDHYDDGLWHLAGERCSRWELGQWAAEAWEIPDPKLTPKLQAEVDCTVPRPGDVTLSCELATAAGFTPPPLLDQLREARKALEQWEVEHFGTTMQHHRWSRSDEKKT